MRRKSADLREPECEQEDVQDVLSQHMEDLPPKMREVMLLYYRTGLRMREIGEIMELTESRVCQIHSNVMARLKAQLDRAQGTDL